MSAGDIMVNCPCCGTLYYPQVGHQCLNGTAKATYQFPLSSFDSTSEILRKLEEILKILKRKS